MWNGFVERRRRRDNGIQVKASMIVIGYAGQSISIERTEVSGQRGAVTTRVLTLLGLLHANMADVTCKMFRTFYVDTNMRATSWC